MNNILAPDEVLYFISSKFSHPPPPPTHTNTHLHRWHFFSMSNQIESFPSVSWKKTPTKIWCRRSNRYFVHRYCHRVKAILPGKTTRAAENSTRPQFSYATCRLIYYRLHCICRSPTTQSLNDLEFDHSRSLKVKSNDPMGHIYDFLLV